MKICITESTLKSCDRVMGDCIKCVPGGGITVVEQLTTEEMMNHAGRISRCVDQVKLIYKCLIILSDRSKLGWSNQEILDDQIDRLSRLRSEIILSVHPLFINLMFKHDTEISLDEDSEIVTQQEI